MIYLARQPGDPAVAENHFENIPIPSKEKMLVPLGTSQFDAKKSDGILHFCRLGPSERNAFISLLRADTVGGAVGHFLNLELLLSVQQYNIFTAMATNAACIGLSMESLRHDIPSPFNTSLPWSMNLPPSLQPTTLQKQKVHHPWVDLFPIASVRDVLLKNDGKFDDDELCHDLFGSCGKDERGPGMFIWGEAWDPFAYEISEKVVRKWLWLFHECDDVFRSSNHWRARRGEKRLVLMDRESGTLS